MALGCGGFVGQIHLPKTNTLQVALPRIIWFFHGI
jgi:hypothetical protein